MKIERMRLIDNPNAGALVAKFNLIGDQVSIFGLGIFRKADGSSWISEPSERNPATGKWWKIVTINDEALREEIERQAKEQLAQLEMDSAAAAADEDVPF